MCYSFQQVQQEVLQKRQKEKKEMITQMKKFRKGKTTLSN